MVGLDSTLALYSIPAALATVFYPHLRMAIAASKFSKWNNLAPRTNLDMVKESGKVSPELAAQLDRMKFAHVNGLETFPLWIGGILAGIIAGLDNYTLNTHALAFLVLRSLYNFAYINQRGQVLSTLRSIFFTCSVAVSLSLIFKAASALSLR
ncbi:hypothetical protein M378DRAFT_163619 [Amanita muscaria Koide BX008]|uniref:Uncharacterized protein n=1 Tax=Amanita muscaria (strain Koide BX008) TaxID=946122 RepID=A0A0C2WR53_AMAMK|nr:hypothetical protein M378DRAFT_163619 [Amanita muscaria Koide BX008]